MQLTKGQKDALVRKAVAIIEEKKNQKREELRKVYKPSKEAAAFIKKLEKFFEARKQYYKIVKDLGFDIEYGYIQTRHPDFGLSICHEENKMTFDQCVEKIRDRELDKIYNDQFKYPTECDVIDDIELMNLSKDFKIDEFLKKYENL